MIQHYSPRATRVVEGIQQILSVNMAQPRTTFREIVGLKLPSNDTVPWIIYPLYLLFLQ